MPFIDQPTKFIANIECIQLQKYPLIIVALILSSKIAPNAAVVPPPD